MEELAAQQKEAGETIQRILTNFKKDSESRKTRQYLKKRIGDLEDEWSYFNENNDALQQYKAEVPTNPYFETEYFKQIKEVYTKAKSLLLSKLQEVESRTAGTSQVNDRQQEDEDKQPETHTQNLNAVRIKKQRVTANAMIRIMESISIEDGQQRSRAYYLQKMQAITNYWSSLANNHVEIIANANEAYPEDEYITEKIYEQLEDQYEECMIRLQSELDAISSTPLVDAINDHLQRPKIKLPPIQIPKFDGDYLNWKAFEELYVQLVHQNTNFSNVEKLQYLKGNLTGNAIKVIQHLSTTGENYKAAWDLLRQRFNNQRLLVSTQIQRLQSQGVLQHESAYGLRKLYDTSKECIVALNNLGVDTTGWDPILLYTLVNKLDKESHRIYEERLSNPKELQTIEHFFTFLEHRFQTLETITDKPIRENRLSKSSNLANIQGTLNSKTSSSKVLGCSICKGLHPLYMCKGFLTMNVGQRKRFTAENKLCINCLQPSHGNSGCKTRRTCRVCQRRHHTLLHQESSYMDSNSTKSTSEAIQSHHTRNGDKKHILLATAIIRVKARDGSFATLRALLDQGSQATFMSEKTAQRLGLRRSKIYVSISGIGQNRADVARSKVNVTLAPRFTSDFKTQTSAMVLKKLTQLIPSTQIPKAKWNHIKGLVLADPTYDQPGSIDIILGADIFPDILLPGLVKGASGSPVGQQTELGWILSGGISNDTSHTITCHIAQFDIENQLRKFWEIEEIPTQRILSKEDEICEQFYQRTTKRAKNGRYIVALPFNENQKDKVLGESRNKAVARLLQLERRFLKDRKLEVEYKKFMNEYINLNHMTTVKTNEKHEVYYFTHHAVMKEDSTTTKLRVVFNGSEKTSTGVSLNDKLLTGPVIQNDLFSNILRWRKNNIAFKADIEKMYRQVKVSNKDQHYQRILWRQSPQDPITEYQLTTLTYGTRPAQFLAVRTLHKLADDEREHFPIAAEVVKRDFVVDDLHSGCETVEKAIQIQDQLIRLLAKGGFKLRKWSSNSSDVLKTLPEELREAGPSEITDGDSQSIKALGIHWHPARDTFEFKVNFPDVDRFPTKRSFLSEASKIFDPLGWLSPVTIITKIMLQELWLAGIGWDEHLPIALTKRWNEFKQDLPALQHLKIPRWVHYTKGCRVAEIHAFSDASEKGYAAAVYLRIIERSGKVTTSLLTSKSKVAPLSKRLSLPKLELCGAVLLTRLVQKVTTAMEWKDMPIIAWTDSKIVISWIKGHPSKWKTFVANRVAKIQSTLNVWHYVKSDENPADLATRGISPKRLKDIEIWWKGPSWLQKESLILPEQGILDTSEEMRKTYACIAMPIHTDLITKLTESYSNLQKLLRIVAYCLRFFHNIRSSKGNRNVEILTLKEIEQAKVIIIQTIQTVEFADDYNLLRKNRKLPLSSKILPLNPFLDTNGIMRVGGRLRNSDLDLDEKHPTILPNKCAYTTLVIREAHEKTLHGGIQETLAYTRLSYWIIGGERAVKRSIHRCVSCFRQRAKPNTQLMGDLPRPRVTISRPFTNTGVDYAGPLELRTSRIRGSKTHKGYIAIFICLATKAIHLEAVSDLSAEAFLAAFKRFTARRGLVRNLYSDNATNFVLANKILQLNLKSFKEQFQTKILEGISNYQTTWHFIPPSAPHFGGLWEAGVKAMKTHLKKTIGNTNLTFEELTTVLAQIEACLNSRPLRPLSAETDDLEVLTPGHFLIGAPILAPPAKEHLTSKVHTLTRWQFLERLHQEFWRKWSSQYLKRMQIRTKWKHKEPNLKGGNIVLLKEDNLPPTKWLLGRILETHAGQDKGIRVATVKTKNGTTKRAISKICALPTIDNDEEEDQPVTITQAIEPLSTVCSGKNEAPKAAVAKTSNIQDSAASLAQATKANQLLERTEKKAVNYEALRRAAILDGKQKQNKSRKRKIQPVSSNYMTLIKPGHHKAAKRPLPPEGSKEESTLYCRSNNEGKKTCPMNTLMLFILALLLTPILGHPSTDPVEVTLFNNHPGFYFEQIGSVSLTNDEWNIRVYYDLHAYWKELEGIEQCMSLLEHLCNATLIRRNYYMGILEQFQHQLKQIESANQLIYKQGGGEPPRRARRSPLDIVGHVANKLFGILDSDYAEDINSEIEKVNLNENHILSLIRNQTSILDSTLNILKKEHSSIDAQFSAIRDQISATMHHIQSTDYQQRTQQAAQDFLSITALTSLVMRNYERIQNEIIHVLTQLHQGKISPLLLSPQQLRSQLALIKDSISSSLALPIDRNDDILRAYNLITVQGKILTSRIVFNVNIPLLRNEKYQLFRIIPLPTPHGNEFVFLEPSSPYLIISFHRDQYYPAEQREIDQCRLVKAEEFLCHQAHPIYNTNSNISRCEVEVLRRDQVTEACKFRRASPAKIWIRLSSPNMWLYASDQEHKIRAVCGTEIVTRILNGEGLVKLRSDCTIKQESVTIHGYSSQVSKTSTSLLPQINITDTLHTRPRLLVENPATYSMDDINMITKTLDNLKMGEKLPETLSAHHIHHYSITYTILGVAASVIIYWIWRKHKQPQSSREQHAGMQQPVPAVRFRKSKGHSPLTAADFIVSSETT